VRKSLTLIQEQIPIQIHEIASGTPCFDWHVPNEWNIKDAYIKDPQGKRVVDFQKNNLHVVGYSTRVYATMSLKELEPHLYTLPKQADAIPYITSYYKPHWGFCLSQKQKESLGDVPYEVVIDSHLAPGVLNYADLLIPGKSRKEILISTYICHPSIANNELSGPVVATFLAKALLQKKDLYYSVRFVFVPETIGSIVYLSRHVEALKKNVVAGYVVTCVGDPGQFSYLTSRSEDSLTDRMTQHVLKQAGSFKLYSYLERGSDERQYCAPGIDLPIGSLMRSKYATYPEYHTSLDNLDFVKPHALYETLQMYLKCHDALDKNHVYKVEQLCEPQMGKRGLYPQLSTKDSADQVRLMMNLLAYCDGEHDLLWIAEKLNCSIDALIPIASLLESHNLITKESKR
jgi:aminopeptidase-like protein